MVEAVVVVYHIIGDGQALLPAGLSGKNAFRLFDRLRIAFHQPPDLCVYLAINNQYSVDKLYEWRSNQERHDDDLVVAAGGIGLPSRFCAYLWMQDGLEILPGVVIAEDDIAHGCAVEVAGGIDHDLTEALANLVKCGLAGLHDFSRDNIGVDNGHTELREHAGYYGLAAGNTTSQADT